VLDRCIRETTIAIGERWREEKPAAAVKRAASTNKNPFHGGSGYSEPTQQRRERK
jgi:hypothetical protein